MLNPQRLVVLAAVLSAGSVHAAARNLNYSPATVSQHLTALARETGLVLFERSGRGIVPTEAALHLAEQSSALLADFDQLERAIADLRSSPQQHLAIACVASVAIAWVPDVVRAVRARHPKLTVEISLNEPMDGRGRHTPDIDVRTEPVAGPETYLDGYRRHELATDDFLAVLPAGHPLAARDEIAMAELRGEPWVDHDIYDSPTGQIIAAACAAAGFRPQYAARLDDHHAALALVATGIGITVLPALALAPQPAGVVARPLVNPTPQRRMVAHLRHDQRRSGIASEALARLRERAAG